MDNLISMDVPPPLHESALALIERHWRLLLGAGAAGFFAGALLSLLLPPWYSSSARLAVIPAEDPTSTAGTNPIDGTNATLPIVVAVLRSRTVAEQTVAQLGLQSSYGTRTPEAARDRLSSLLEVSTDRKSNLITLSVEDHSPARARAIAEAVARLTAARTAELWAAHNHEQRARLEAEEAETTGQLTLAEERRRAFRERSGIVDLSAQLRATVEEAAALEKLRVEKRLELHFARGFSGEDAVEVRRAGQEQAAAVRELEVLRRRGAGLFLALQTLPALELEEAQHHREIERLSARRDLVALKLSQLIAADTRSGGRAELIDPPSQPLGRSRPSMMGLGGEGAVTGALIAALFLLALDRWRRRRRLG